MKTVTIQFEFSDDYNHNEIVDTIMGCISDMDYELAESMTYTIVGRK